MSDEINIKTSDPPDVAVNSLLAQTCLTFDYINFGTLAQIMTPK